MSDVEHGYAIQLREARDQIRDLCTELEECKKVSAAREQLADGGIGPARREHDAARAEVVTLRKALAALAVKIRCVRADDRGRALAELRQMVDVALVAPEPPVEPCEHGVTMPLGTFGGVVQHWCYYCGALGRSTPLTPIEWKLPETQPQPKPTEAEAKLVECRREREQHFDCHPADGVSRCGACITCLTKDLEERGRVQADLMADLMAYIDAAKIAAGDHCVTGQPLAEAVESMAEEIARLRERPEAAAGPTSGITRVPEIGGNPAAATQPEPTLMLERGADGINRGVTRDVASAEPGRVCNTKCGGCGELCCECICGAGCICAWVRDSKCPEHGTGKAAAPDAGNDEGGRRRWRKH